MVIRNNTQTLTYKNRKERKKGREEKNERKERKLTMIWLFICNNTKGYFPWKPEKIKVKFLKNCENTGEILKISCVRYLTFIFSGSYDKFCSVLLSISNYTYPLKNVKKNAILFKFSSPGK